MPLVHLVLTIVREVRCPKTAKILQENVVEHINVAEHQYARTINVVEHNYL